MSSIRRLFLLTLIFGILIGLGSPAWVQAEKPTPEVPAVSETPSTPDTDTAPVFVAENLLASSTPPSGCGGGMTSWSSTPNLPIPDEGVITATLDFVDTGYLWSAELTTSIAHSFNADLDITLISPAGTEVTISTDNGGSTDNVFNGTVWSDQWVGLSVSDYAYTNGVAVPFMSPEEALSAFTGENPNGTWKLVIHDDASLDTGTLVSWSLKLHTLELSPRSQVVASSISPNASIPDNGTYTSSMSITAGYVHDFDIQTNITHPANNELDIYLVSPTGLTVTLTTDNGGTFANGFSNTLWDDQAGEDNPPGPVTDNEFQNGVAESPVVVENALAAFNGTYGNGNWKLIVKDDTVGNTGTLDFWQIWIESQSCLADLMVYQDGAPYPAELGEPVAYDLYITNLGASPATDVVLTDTLPVGTTFLSWAAPAGWNCTTPPVGGTGSVTCNGDSLASDAQVILHLQLSPLSIPQWLPENQVEVSSSSPETSIENNTDTYSHYTGLLSTNGNPWEIYDHLNGDNGGVEDGGQDAFDDYGMLRLRVLDEANTTLTDNAFLSGWALTFDGIRGWTSQTPRSLSDITISRAVYAPTSANYVRYLDTYTNTSNAVRQVRVAWGGDLGSDTGTTLAATSSGDLVLDTGDVWAVTIQESANDPAGPALDPPVGYALRGAGDLTYLGHGDFDNNPFETPWPGNDNDGLAHVFAFTLQPGETVHLLYFLYRGLSETKPGPEGCTTNCIDPPDGSEIALAQTVLAALTETPDVCDLPASVRANLINWPELNISCPVPEYPVFIPIVVR